MGLFGEGTVRVFLKGPEGESSTVGEEIGVGKWDKETGLLVFFYLICQQRYFTQTFIARKNSEEPGEKIALINYNDRELGESNTLNILAIGFWNSAGRTDKGYFTEIDAED